MDTIPMQRLASFTTGRCRYPRVTMSSRASAAISSGCSVSGSRNILRSLPASHALASENVQIQPTSFKVAPTPVSSQSMTASSSAFSEANKLAV